TCVTLVEAEHFGVERHKTALAVDLVVQGQGDCLHHRPGLVVHHKFSPWLTVANQQVSHGCTTQVLNRPAVLDGVEGARPGLSPIDGGLCDKTVIASEGPAPGTGGDLDVVAEVGGQTKIVAVLFDPNQCVTIAVRGRAVDDLLGRIGGILAPTEQFVEVGAHRSGGGHHREDEGDGEETSHSPTKGGTATLAGP